MEIWKPVVGYEGLYEVSNLGRVKSLFYRKTKLSRILSQRITRLGYASIQLKGGKNFFVHRLVGASFLGLNINDRKQCVLHKDDNPLNNNIDNLFIGDHYDNMRDMTNKGRNKYPDLSKKVFQFNIDGNLIAEWKSLEEAKNTLGISKASISLCCNGKMKSARGFIWKYKNN